MLLGPLLLPLGTARGTIGPYTKALPRAAVHEATWILREMRSAKTIRVSYVDGPKVLATRTFWRDDLHNDGLGLLSALSTDFSRRPNSLRLRCEFHADVAIVATGIRTLKAELCFGCGAVRVEVPGSRAPRTLWWIMSNHGELKRAVRILYPGVSLGRDGG